MGAWGAGLYSDDTTCEVRDDYIAHLKRGLGDAEAGKDILDRFGELLLDREVECLVYFALADTQWKYGRLEPGIRDHALALIEQGGDLSVWERDAPQDVSARKKVLLTLKERLLSETPPRRAVRIVKPAPKKVRTAAPIGSLFLLPLPGGLFAALVLVGHQELEKSIEPVFTALSWRGDNPPSPDQLELSRRKTIQFDTGLGKVSHVGIFGDDGRKNPLAALLPTAIVMEGAFPYDANDMAFISVARIARDIDRFFDP